ncbi:MAG: hypothetical protein H0W61_11660 [Bacteroidetes bacterium]|nr:hypothetical protein [Bacteroidota bacterium]
MKFEEISFSRDCPTISWSFHCIAEAANTRPEILRIMFHGVYRKDQAGSKDSHLISVMVDAAVKFWRPKFAIIDLSDLEYTGGEDFEKIYDSVDDDDILTVVLVGEKSRKAMTELYFGNETGKDIVDNNFFFDNIDRAIKKLRDQ